MKRLILVITLLLGLLVSALPASAAEASITQYRYKGSGAEAHLSGTDPLQCVFSEIGVTAGESAYKERRSQPQTAAGVLIWVAQTDTCAQPWVYRYADGWVDLDAEAFHITSSLSNATLEATVQVYDWANGTSFPVNVSLTWTADGAASRERSHSHYVYPGMKVNTKSEGTRRLATVGGMVRVDGVDMQLDPGQSAAMWSSGYNYVTIVHE